MDNSRKQKRIIGGALILLTLIVLFRVGMNIMAKQEQANKSGRGKVAVVTAGHPSRMTISPVFRFSGKLTPVWQADVAAKVDGRIERVLVAEGQSVEAGEALVLLEQTDTNAKLLNAEGAYYDAQAALDKAEADYKRYAYLYEKDAVSREEMDRVKFALHSAQGKMRTAEGGLASAQSQSGGTQVTTPRAGIVQRRYYQEGYYAKVGTALFNIADISTLLAKIDVPEGYVSNIAVGGTVAFTIPSMAGEDKTVHGTITRISPVATDGARTFEVEVAVPNTDGRLRGGVYAEARIAGVEKPNTLTVPLASIAMRDDQRTVYVIEDGSAVRRVLETGYIGDNFVEILGGVTEEDQIITGGINKVREGAKVRVSEGEAP